MEAVIITIMTQVVLNRQGKCSKTNLKQQLVFYSRVIRACPVFVMVQPNLNSQDCHKSRLSILYYTEPKCASTARDMAYPPPPILLVRNLAI